MGKRGTLRCTLARWTLAAALLATLALAAPTPSLGRPTPARAADADFLPDELLVRFAAGPSRTLRATTLNDLGATVLDTYRSSGVVRLQVPPGTLAQTQQRLLDAGLVEFAEPNYRLRVAQLVPSDALYAQQQAVFYERLDGPGGWAVSTGSRDVVVALIDGAVDLDHPDLAANIWTNPGEIPGNGEDDDGNGFIDDLHGYDFVGDWQGGGESKPNEDPDPDAKPGDPALGDGQDQDSDGTPDGALAHGTQVAGILAAVGGNDLGIVGAAWEASIMPLRITSPEGDGLFSGLIAALDYATLNGAHVVNISLASSVIPEAARVAVDAATDAGLIVVAAAGNSGHAVAFPGALPNVIAVGSTEGAGAPPAPEPATRPSAAQQGAELTAAGAFGPPFFTPAGPEIELVAPGVDVPATSVSSTGEPEYAFATGTSFSAPFVTGTVVLILAQAPAATLSDVRALLQAGSEDLPDGNRPNWDGGENGGGLLNIGLTLQTFAVEAPAAPLLSRVEVAGDRIELEGEAEIGSTVTIFADSGPSEAGSPDDAPPDDAPPDDTLPDNTLPDDAPPDDAQSDDDALPLSTAGVEQPPPNGEPDDAEPDDGDPDEGEPGEDPTGDTPAQLPAGAIALAQPDEAGHFSATVLLAAFDETTAVITITATASRSGAVSPLSDPVALPLPLDLELVAGWNLAGWAAPPSSSADLFATLPQRVLRLYAWDGQAWGIAVSGDARFTIPEITTGQALWLLVAPGPSIPWRQTRAPYQPARLVPGWQLIAWVGPSAEVSAATAQTTAAIELIHAWNGAGQAFRVFFPRLPTLGTLQQLAHFQGLWVLLEAGQAGTWPDDAGTP